MDSSGLRGRDIMWHLGSGLVLFFALAGWALFGYRLLAPATAGVWTTLIPAIAGAGTALHRSRAQLDSLHAAAERQMESLATQAPPDHAPAAAGAAAGGGESKANDSAVRRPSLEVVRNAWGSGYSSLKDRVGAYERNLLDA